jgi:hypothetical protein
VTTFIRELSDLFAGLAQGLDDLGVPEGQLFLISPAGVYDVALNRYSSVWLASSPWNTQAAHARDLRTSDTVLTEAAARGRRPTVTSIERLPDLPHATFHRHYANLIDAHFRPRIPAPARPAVAVAVAVAVATEPSGSDVRTEADLSRLRKENSDLRRTPALYEEAIRKLALENDALRRGAAVIPLPNRSTLAPPAPSWIRHRPRRRLACERTLGVARSQLPMIRGSRACRRHPGSRPCRVGAPAGQQS